MSGVSLGKCWKYWGLFYWHFRQVKRESIVVNMEMAVLKLYESYLSEPLLFECKVELSIKLSGH